MIRNHHQNTVIVIISLTATLLFLGIIVGPASAIVQTQAQEDEEQIIINPTNIKELKAFGETDKPWYPENYPPEYLFDNLINSYSFWTQQGKSGFNLELNEKLDKSVCSIELGVLQPQNTPFSLIIINNQKQKNVTGTLSNEQIPIKIGSNNNNNNNNCIPNVTKLSMNFTPVDRLTWTTLSEIKLLTDKTTTEPPPIIIPSGNVTKFEINNSNVTMDLNDSDVTLNLPANSNAKVNTLQEEEEEEQDEDKDKDGDKDDKKEKDKKN